MSNDIESTQLFGVPIFRKRFPAFFEHQIAIPNHILALRRRDCGLVRSNFGGWHSSEEFHLGDDDNVSWLMQRITDVCSRCVHQFEGNRTYGEIRMLAAWANVNTDGAWNAPHMHLPAQWSGVFYVDLGDMDTSLPLSDQNGSILFFDPLPLGERFKRPPTHAMAPEAGTMLLFPAYLNHMVTPYAGKAPRISIAFNLRASKQNSGTGGA